MELEKQVCSLSSAKKLQEFNVKQESHFKWCEFDKNDEFYDGEQDRLFTEEQWENYSEDWCPPECNFYSAFTVAELGEMLPAKTCWRGYSNNRGKWGFEFGDFRAEAETEADARAIMLIYLRENRLINLAA